MYKSEFTRKIMSWLKSNEPTMIDNEKETQTIYIRIPFNGLEYIYSMPACKIGKGVYEEFDFNAIYSTKEKICLFKNFWGKQMTTIQEEGMGFYERFSIVENFNKIFRKILPSIFVAKYKNKALNKIKIEAQEPGCRDVYYMDKARAIYLQGEKAGPVIPVPLGGGLMMVGKNILSTGASPQERKLKMYNKIDPTSVRK